MSCQRTLAFAVPGWLVLTISCVGSAPSPGTTHTPTASSASLLAPSKRPYRIVDAMPAFWKFWEQAQALPIDQRELAFRSVVVGANPALFDAMVIGFDPTLKTSGLDTRLGPYLATLDSRIPIMRKLSKSVAEDLDRYDGTFRFAFPDMRWSGTVYSQVA